MRTRIFALVVCLALLSSFCLASRVQAAVGITPVQGVVGTEVTVSDLSAGLSYIIKWDGADHKTGTVPSGGVVYFTVSASSGGSHTVVVESPSGTQVFTGSFTILPLITIDPSSGTVGTSVAIEGTGFAAAEDSIKVTYGGTNVKTGITADDNGSWNTTFEVPSSVEGSHVVDASGSATEAGDIADKTFTVSPQITLDPTAGIVGTSVIVTGTAFDSGESNIKVTYDGKEVRTGIVADVKGSWNTTFRAPSSTKGSHVVDASGENTGAGDIPDVTFTVLPGTSVAPSSGYVGDEIEVKGSGFANNESGIKVTFDDEVIIEDLDADDYGNWMTSLTIPAGANGDHAIDAYGNTTVSADVLDSIITIEAKIVLSPKDGDVGESVSVTGTGFSRTKDFSVSYADVSVISGLTTDIKGNFSASFEAPKGKSGDINVTATDADGVTASATFTMETTPPEMPRIASPKDGARIGYIGDVKVTFDWTDVSDPSGVYYALQISSQSNFASMLLEIDDLAYSEYTLTEAESLSHGKYYWRVQAIDEAGNASDWTAPAMVKAGYMTVKTLVIIIASIVGLIILATILPWIIRRIIRAVRTS